MVRIKIGRLIDKNKNRTFGLDKNKNRTFGNVLGFVVVSTSNGCSKNTIKVLMM